MAQKTDILGIKGPVGGLVFAKDGSVQQKPASNKSTFNDLASMVRVGENASGFGAAATVGKLLRDNLLHKAARSGFLPYWWVGSRGITRG